MRSSRDLDQRIEVLKLSIDVGVPLIAQLRARGSLEAQTRRNLLVRSEGVAKLTQKFAASGLEALFEPLIEHMQIVERAFTQSATNGVRLVTESVNQILGT